MVWVLWWTCGMIWCNNLWYDMVSVCVWMCVIQCEIVWYQNKPNLLHYADYVVCSVQASVHVHQGYAKRKQVFTRSCVLPMQGRTAEASAHLRLLSSPERWEASGSSNKLFSWSSLLIGTKLLMYLHKWKDPKGSACLVSLCPGADSQGPTTSMASNTRSVWTISKKWSLWFEHLEQALLALPGFFPSSLFTSSLSSQASQRFACQVLCKAYPTYDFACPIVDALEASTSLRSATLRLATPKLCSS